MKNKNTPDVCSIRLCRSSHLEIDVRRMFSQHSHHVSEALIDSNVERRAHRVVQKVNICPFTQQQPCNLCLITKVKDTTNRKDILFLHFCWMIPPVPTSTFN